jgi:hypothetical protein
VSSKRDGAVDEVVLTLAGLADLALSQVARMLRPVGDVVKRSDLNELTRDGHGDLKSRGELALDRRLPAAPGAHLETLARRAAVRSTSADA